MCEVLCAESNVIVFCTHFSHCINHNNVMVHDDDMARQPSQLSIGHRIGTSVVQVGMCRACEIRIDFV